MSLTAVDIRLFVYDYLFLSILKIGVILIKSASLWKFEPLCCIIFVQLWCKHSKFFVELKLRRYYSLLIIMSLFDT